jgi:hypothetical protein
MSMYALLVTSADIIALQQGILFRTTNATDINNQVLAINAPNATQTVTSYANQLLGIGISTSQIAMGVSALMTGQSQSVATLTNFVTNPGLIPSFASFALANKLDATQVVGEDIGLAFAGNANFVGNFGGQSLTAFSQSMFGMFGIAQSFTTSQVQFFINLYNSFGLPGIPAPTAAQIQAAAYGVVFGLDVALNLEGTGSNGAAQTTQTQVKNALFDIAQTAESPPGSIYVVNAPLAAQPIPIPFQGGGPPPTTSVFLTTGVDTPTQGFANSNGTPLNPPGFTATTNNTTFNATFGGAGATWTPADQVTAAAGTTGQIFNIQGIGPAGAIDVTSLMGNRVSGIQTVNITAAPMQAVQGDFTATGPEGEWTGLALLTVTSASTATAADNLTVGPAVAVQVMDTAISAPDNLPTMPPSSPTGPYLTVNGGSTVTINQNNMPGINLHSIIVNGGSGTRSVSITQTETMTPQPNQDYARVNINDVNGASTTAPGTITTVVLDGLAHFLGITAGPNMIVDNALTNLIVNNSEPNPVAGTDLLIVNNMTTPTATTLNLSLSEDGVNAAGMGVNFLVLTDVKNEYSTVHLSLGAKNSVLFFTDNGLTTLDTPNPGTGALVNSVNDTNTVLPNQFQGGDGTMVKAGPSAINDDFPGNVKIDLSGLNGPNNVTVNRGATTNTDTYTLGNFGTDNTNPATSQKLTIVDTQPGFVDTISFGSGAYNIFDAPHMANHSYVNTAPDGAALAAGLIAQQWAAIFFTKAADTLTFNGNTVQQIFNDGPMASVQAGINLALTHAQHSAAAFQVGGNTFIFDHAGTGVNISPTDSLVELVGVAFNANTVSPGGVIHFA